MKFLFVGCDYIGVIRTFLDMLIFVKGVCGTKTPCMISYNNAFEVSDTL